MKNLILIPAILLSTFVLAQTRCENGFAGPYPCNGFDLLSSIDLGALGAGSGNDNWGWTDPLSGREYVISCLDNGTAFIDITDPLNPVYLGKLPTHTSSSTWRDAKTYQDHVFVVSEAGGHGMQVFDLTRLRDVNPATVPATFTEDAHYDGFGSSHNIVINEDTGYAYSVGTSTFDGGAHFVNIQDPTNPVAAGGYSTDNYTHDAQVVTYNGPDSDYQGQELFIGSNGDFSEPNEIVIVDVTDKNNPTQITSIQYPTAGYAHQGWFTEDQRYFILGDELDEGFFGINTRTLVFDFEDLDNPSLSFEYFGPTLATDHNGYVVGDTYYLANYRAGLRVLDISDIENGNMTEIGFFDTFPSSNSSSTSGVWNVYPFFASGNIAINDINTGFYLVRDSNDPLTVQETQKTRFSIFPNPATSLITIDMGELTQTGIEIYSVTGKLIYENNQLTKDFNTIDVAGFSSGMYVIRFDNGQTEKLFVR